MSEPIVVFPHVEGAWSDEDCALQRDLARIMVASARAAMPGIKVYMLTNEKTPAIEGVDEAWRRSIKSYWIPWVCDFCAHIDGKVLYLDTDIVVMKDLRPLFNVPADVVLTNRGPKVFEDRMMPFLFGVVPYTNKEFWAEVRDRVLAMPAIEDLNWWGSQVVAFQMFMEEQHGRGKWNIASIDCATYNYTPKDAQETPEGKWALHYKGRKRKAWMRERWGHLIAPAEQKVAA